MAIQVTVDCDGTPVRFQFDDEVDLEPGDVLDVSIEGNHFKAVCQRTGEEFLLLDQMTN